ncbi:MAG: 2-phosphosulfolactate phosphatase, partial [Bacteroidales bacterium]|nr:2-phosphosulfolactate phosphatase [Bacteroidales bacterium]
MISSERKKVEVCLSPALYTYFENPAAVAVVVDVLRASSAIVTAFMNGAEKIIPVATLEEAKEMKDKGFMVAAERDGIVRDFADFGNSPYNFTPERVEKQPIVYSTTNGTQAIQLASSSHTVIVGAFLNLKAIADFLKEMNRDVLILCAGWKNKVNLEDTLFAGALAELLLMEDNFYTICDSTLASLDLWMVARHNLTAYIDKAAQRHRLKKNNLDDVIEYCLSSD